MSLVEKFREYAGRYRAWRQSAKDYALQRALWDSDIMQVAYALDSGANPNGMSRGEDANYPLMLIPSRKPKTAGEYGPRFMLMMLMAGGDPNLKDAAGNTPLHEAATGGDILILKFLMKAGADPRIANSKGETALGILKAAAEFKSSSGSFTPKQVREAQEKAFVFGEWVKNFDPAKKLPLLRRAGGPRISVPA